MGKRLINFIFIDKIVVSVMSGIILSVVICFDIWVIFIGFLICLVFFFLMIRWFKKINV